MSGSNSMYMFIYSSPLEIAMAVCAFRFFENININKRYIQRELVTLSGLDFDVYIIHSHIFIFENIIKGNFSALSDMNPLLIIILLIGIIFAVYICCTIIGYVRKKMFEILKFPELFSKVTKDKLSYSLEK